MTLQKQTVPLTYGGGLDTKTDASSVPLGKWLVLENCTFAKPQSLHKRNGYTALGQTWVKGTILSAMPLYTSNGIQTSVLNGGAVTVGKMLGSRSNELLLGDGTNLYSYDQANTTWVSKGSLPTATLTTVAQIVNQNTLTQYDTALHSGGLQIVVARQMNAGSSGADGLIYAVIDTATGQLVVAPTQLDTATNQPQSPKVCVLGAYFFIAWQRSNGGTFTAVGQAISVSSPLTPVYASPQAITSGVGTSALQNSGTSLPAWDMTVSNGEIYLAFVNRSGTTTVFGITAVATYTQSHSVVVAGTAPVAICVTGNPVNTDVSVGFVTTGALSALAFVYSSDLATQRLAPTTLDTQANGFVAITGVGTASGVQFFLGWATGATFDDASFIRKVALSLANSVGAASTIGRQLKIAGKPALRSGSVYLPAWLTGLPIAGSLDEALQPTWMLIDSSGLVIARAFPANGAGYHSYGFSTTKPASLPETPQTTAGQLNPPVGVISYVSFGTGSTPSDQTLAVNIVQVSFSDTVNQFTKAQLGGPVLLSGAVPRIYDGAQVVEQGFLSFPEISTLTNAAGGNLSAGTYSYVAVYQWQDATGQTHQSAPSPAKTVVASLNDKVTVVVSTLRQTQKSNVLISIFRTIANGTTLTQVTNQSTGSQLLNDTTNATVSYVDSASDAITQVQKQIYTTGNVVQSAAPPPLNSVIVHRNRAFGIDPTTGQLDYTKQYVPGSTGQPIEFSASFTMNVDTRGGNPTALASLDEKLIVFKQDRIFTVLGQGPDSTGANSDFTDAILVSSDTGCTAPKSVVVVPDGLMFKSPKGIYLLDRALKLSYIGAAVESYNSSNVTSAQLISSANQVRFSLDSGAVLVYDYYMGQWSVFTNIGAADTATWQGVYVYLTGAGFVYQETVGSFVDPGSTYIAIRAVSPYIQLAQVQGFQRIYKVLLLANFVSAHQLTIKLGYDFATSFSQTNNITVASDPAPYQTRIFTAKQKCEAFQISVQDVSTGTNGESLVLSGLMLEVGVKRGAYKLPASKSYG